MASKTTNTGTVGDEEGYVDLLRLMDNERRLLTQRTPADAKSSQRAAALSLPVVRAELTQPAGNTGKHIFYPAELNPSSITLLHGAFVHPKSMCTLYFRATDNEQFMLKGKVSSCIHVKGRAHEVVVELENPIDLNMLIPGAGSQSPAPAATGSAGDDEKSPTEPGTALAELAKDLASFSKSLASDPKASATARQMAARVMLIAKSVAA